MGAKKRNTQLSVEETRVLDYYRLLGRWERNSVHILLQSLSWGKLTEKSDKLPWPKIARIVGLPGEARHG